MLGRPNVGKSTLFNRLIRSNRAITHDRPGVTRDRMEGRVRNKFHRPFIIVDTGGITLDYHSAVTEGPSELRGFEKEILSQAKAALEDACGICLVVDGRDGLTPFDEHLANYVRRLSKNVLLVVNKVDGMEREDIMCADFHVLGFPMVAVSAEHGNQIRYLESLMVDMLPETPDDDEAEIMNSIVEDDKQRDIDTKKRKKAGDRVQKDKYEDEFAQADTYIQEGLAQPHEANKAKFKNSAELDEADSLDDMDLDGDPEDFLVDFDESAFNESSDGIPEQNTEPRSEFDGELHIDFGKNTFDVNEFGNDGFSNVNFEKGDFEAGKEIFADDEDHAVVNTESGDILPIVEKPKKKEGPLKICLLGRPNAGKSSILNAFVGKIRMIVSEVAGTTRDSVDVPLLWQGNTYIFVDTAGVRRRSKISDVVERFSVNSSLKSTSKADVTFLVIDALQGLTAQDKRLIELLDERKTPFLIILNKMDLVPAAARKSLQKQFSEALAFCHHVPVMQTSAKSSYGLKMLLPMAEQIKAECYVRIGTGKLNRAMESVLTKHQPPVVRRVRPKFYYLTQAESEPPTFVFFVNDAERVGDSYARYIENSLRRLFAIEHAPMRVHLRSSHTKNSDKRSGKKPKADFVEQKVASQYIDQKPRDKGDDKQGEAKAKAETKPDKKGSAGKAKATSKGRTTLKAALRNPSSIQSRSLKKSQRKKKK